MNLAPIRVTFKQTVDEWIDYVENDRKRRPSAARLRRAAKNMLLRIRSRPPSRTSTADVDAYRAGLVKEGRLVLASTSRWCCYGVFRLAVRRHGLRTNPVAAAERQPEHRQRTSVWTGDVAVRRQAAENAQDGALSLSRRSRGYAWGAAGVAVA